MPPINNKWCGIEQMCQIELLLRMDQLVEGKHTAEPVFTAHSENSCTNLNVHFRLLMAARWKFLKFGIYKKFQWNFVYFWSVNYYGCMSLLFWKGRQSEMNFMLFMADCSLVKSLCWNCPEEWHCTSKLKSCATVTQSFLHLGPCSVRLHTRPSQEPLPVLWDCLIFSACGFSRSFYTHPQERNTTVLSERKSTSNNE